MSDTYFSKLLPALGTRAARATVSRLGFSSPPLRQHLLDTFSRGYGQSGCFLGEPVFEATFGWRQAEPTFGALAGALLHPALVDALDAPGGDNGKEYRFPRDGHPYTHQLAAWQALLAPTPQSVVVTSGTGSGKTECFMVPVLSRLAAEHAAGGGAPVQGVRALFLYPLNALIQSQRERLRAWTAPFGDGLRFCLYNGNTPDQSKAEEQRKAPNEVLDRATLRRSPPPILVTNPTMLEYMLVRAQDAPILQQSQEKLEWIVLDEAHNYIGSQAAELALLLRRVLHAFGTSADRVRFVATSATIAGGGDKARQELRRFLADLAGVDESRVAVVEGTRQVPELSGAVEAASAPQGPQELVAAGPADDPAGRYRRLSAHPFARRLRSMFVPAAGGRGWQPLQAVKDALRQDGRPHDDTDALAWLDLLTSAVEGRGRQVKPFLPLRLHAFHDTLDGLWVCADAACALKAGTALAHPDWPYGLVHMEERRHCGCGAPVYPLVSCNDCNETFLSAEICTIDGGMRLVAPADEQEVDEFLLDRQPEARDADEDADADEATGAALRESALLVGTGHGTAAVLDRRAQGLRFDLATPPDASAVAVRLQQERADDEGHWALRCPCCAGAEPLQLQFRRPRLGAPFLLGTVIPTLLEFCPDGDSPLDRPMRARRMITFTDSRQGTARIAARLQQDAERTALRAGVYLRLAQGTAGSAAERAALQERVQNLQGMLKFAAGDPAMKGQVEKMLQEELHKLQQLDGGKAVDWREMARWLATQPDDVSRWIAGYYGSLEPRFNSDDRGREELAEVLLCREFAHRPKRANSLETLGLVAVQYPKLQQVAALPPAPQAEGLSPDDWRDFLKLCLDFFVRDRWCLQMPPGWQRWGAQRTWIKNVLPPGSKEKTTPWLVRWPQVTNRAVQPPLVRLLARVLKLDARTTDGRSRIDALLRAAWDDLVRVGLLHSTGTARYLDPQDMALRHITQGWMCPVTRRVLDTTLRGVTPYLPPQPQDDAQVHCRPVRTPVCALVAQTYDDVPSRLAAVRAWIEAQPEIAQARAEGLWSDISDRVLEGAGYFRAVEHSAQQSGELLKLYEREFRDGRINLMSCSTTMEMGVDIGGINMVAMNNVPPHPANYLQRAGRAGRRAETRSVALTVCKNNPHDQHVFAHTDWPFTTPMRTPGISLSSAVLVRRHVNALLLSRFLRLQGGDGRLDKLTMEWWMLPPEGTQDATRQERFVAWCEEAFDEARQADTVAGLRALVKSTALQGIGPRALAREVGAHAARHAAQWLDELQALDAQLAALAGKDGENRMPRRALEIQRKRLTGEYLLRELASSGFLPGYGFPTDITSFETLNKDSQEIKRQREAQAGREDNRFQRRELPSRDTVTALREYAPGASVVIDGLVYESAGITLNWHVPATADAANELQNIRHAWRCRHCGANGTHVQHLGQCPDCGHALGMRKDVFRQYLEPAGFSVDLYETTHNDITQQRYVAPQLPWISGCGDWLPLPNAALGRFRASAEGSVFHHSSGPGGHGYAVCLECGRAAAMGDPDIGDPTPAVFKKPHLRLRGRRGKDGAEECGGSDQPFKIKQGLHFGREYSTDVLELTLRGLDGQPLADPVVAFSLVVALRRAIARWLGIDEGELGCDTKELRDEAGQRHRALQIFDLRAAGYSTLVAQRLPQLLHEAREGLLCERECDGACQHCLLGYDTRFRVDDLDRRQALAFLTPQWLAALALRPELQLFGPRSQAEVQPLEEALVRELGRADARRLVLYLHGAPADWDLAASPLKALLHRLSVKALEGEAALCLVTPQADLSGLDAAEAAVLRSLQQACAVELRAGSAPLLLQAGRVLATLERSDGGWRSWGTQEAELAQPDAQWGRPGTQPLVVSSWDPSGGPELSDRPVRLPEAAPAAPGGWTVEIGRELDGAGSGFGGRFWTALGRGDIAAVLPAGKRVAGVTYEDRYLHTPIACALLVEVLSALKGYYEPQDGWGTPPVRVTTMFIERKPPRAGQRGSVWTADWPGDAQRDAALGEALAYAGIPAQVRTAARHDTRHARLLQVDFDDGTRLRVVPDQGVSYWTVDHARTARLPRGFSPDGEPAALAEVLSGIEADVRGHDAPTLVAVDRG